MLVELYDHQRTALDKMQNGSILCGGVGSGKSRTSIAYYYKYILEGDLEHKPYWPKKNVKLYIITTARKRDTHEWDQELIPFGLSIEMNKNLYSIPIVVDSWNNIKKYIDVKDAFFIFDEQRVVGSGTWVKSFLKITKSNRWILLSATPGDTWSDYIPVFIANGFYKNRTEFLRRHAVYDRFSKYPKINRYLETGHLLSLRKRITVYMNYTKPTVANRETVITEYDRDLFKYIMKERWNPYEDAPVRDAAGLCYLARRIVNSDPSRLKALETIFRKHKKVIVFYNFNYELELLRSLGAEWKVPVAEWNGHKHEPIPTGEQWLYFVQYTAGAEGWNCIETNTIVFFSQNYSYKTMIQAAGRIDRLNTPFPVLYYYTLRSSAPIDIAIMRALKEKKNFNEREFCDF